MGERKVLNYYIPYDFDASIIPKGRERPKQIEVRTMLAFSIQCNTCGEYMYRGKKFNSRCERLENDTYLGIKKFRFYIKCSVCAAEIIFKTDPKNADYEMESGAKRNFEAWRETKANQEELDKQREEEEKMDSMKALENRTLDNKIEMDVLDALDEIKSINKRHEKVDTNALLLSIGSTSAVTSSSIKNDLLTESDELLIKSIQFKSNKRRLDSTESAGEEVNGVVAVVVEEEIVDTNKTDGIVSDAVILNKSNNNNLLESIQKEILFNNSKKTNTTNSNIIITKKKRVDDTITKGISSSSSSSSTLISTAPTIPSTRPSVLPISNYSSDSDSTD